MKDVKSIIIVFLLGVTVVCVSRFIIVLKEKQALLEDLERSRMQVTLLTKEKQNLLQSLEKEKKFSQVIMQKNSWFKHNLKASSRKISWLFTDYGKAAREKDELNSQIEALKAENAALKQRQESLKQELGRVSREKEHLNAGIGKERELKKPSPDKTVSGNAGFLTKTGAPIPAANVKIEVNPHPPVTEEANTPIRKN